jgi:hypothetical protein
VTLNGDSGALSTVNSTLVASPDNLEANGSNTSLVTLTLRDSNNNPVTGQAVAFAATLGTIGTVSGGSGGVYKAIFTTSKSSGTGIITVNVNGNVFNITPATIKMTTVLLTSPNQLGSMIIPAEYDLVVFSISDGNWSSQLISLPSVGVKNGNKITINSVASFSSYLDTSNTNLLATNPLVIKTSTSYSFIYNSTTSKWDNI